MEISKKINDLKKSIFETDQMVDELIASLNARQIRLEKKEKKIAEIKAEVKINVEKIDKIIEKINGNS